MDLVISEQQSQVDHIRNSVGLNFGSRYMTGFGTWPVNKFIPETMFRAAADVFAFDALIQNPDRKFDNPNLLSSGDNLLIIDHETAFSFLFAMLSSAAPWNLDSQRYLTDHVLYKRLKSKAIDLTSFTASLAGLSDGVLAGIVADVPVEWNNDNVQRIERHLRSMREHAEEFAEHVRRFLV